MNCIQNITGYITKESCNYVIKGECISGLHFILFILSFIIMSFIAGFIIGKIKNGT